MSSDVSPLAPKSIPVLQPLAGVRLASHACGLRYQGRTDLMVAELASGTSVAGVYTRSLTCSAPVLWCRKAQKGGKARLLVVNSGNANAFTGGVGEASVSRTVAGAAKLTGCAPEEVFIASTGTIGVPLDDFKITDALPEVLGKLSADNWDQAARAIMTTDTYPKLATRTAKIGDAEVRINGFCKGAGMIAPDMATMLAYVFTDATLSPDVLQDLLSAGVETVLQQHHGGFRYLHQRHADDLRHRSGQRRRRSSRPRTSVLKAFRKALDSLLLELALAGGQGWRGRLQVRRDPTSPAPPIKRRPRTIGMAIANSPLVKTAISGEDANWGRVVWPVGKAGEKADRDRLSIKMGGFQVALNGLAVPDYDETPVAAHMKGQDILIEVDVGIGKGKATVWTCDLTHAYIDINGSYRS